jgi:hypothetical protein
METVVARCRMCGKPMNVPRVMAMVFTFDPTVCNQCRERIPGGMWDTEREDGDGGRDFPPRKPNTTRAR